MGLWGGRADTGGLALGYVRSGRRGASGCACVLVRANPGGSVCGVLCGVVCVRRSSHGRTGKVRFTHYGTATGGVRPEPTHRRAHRESDGVEVARRGPGDQRAPGG
eukprot:scaffold43713_cov75-Phaeocystis_antarctica.AAC.1